eukprot:347628-Chlamydomonas_euryale.AAC.3
MPGAYIDTRRPLPTSASAAGFSCCPPASTGLPLCMSPAPIRNDTLCDANTRGNTHMCRQRVEAGTLSARGGAG